MDNMELSSTAERTLDLGSGFAADESSASVGVPALLAAVGFGIAGCGHVISWVTSGQNSRIFSNRYHWRSRDRPFGSTCSGSCVGMGFHESFSNFTRVSSVSQCFFAYTTPGSA